MASPQTPPQRQRVITLDGPAGVGKTTLSKRLAGALGLPYLDTGAMYRVVGKTLCETYPALAASPAPEDAPEDDRIREALAAIHFALEDSGASTRLVVNEVVVGDEIRTETVARFASLTATRKVVRERLTQAQRQLGEAGPLVAEGRDMGAVVFPHAAPKFFLDADPTVRAQRRLDQLRAMGVDVLPTLEDLATAIAERDHQDRTRAEAPLQPADDAILVDTSDLTEDEVFALLLSHCAD